MNKYFISVYLVLGPLYSTDWNNLSVSLSQYQAISILLALKYTLGTSLVVQWLRIRTPMQGTQVRSLVGELRSHMPWGN